MVQKKMSVNMPDVAPLTNVGMTLGALHGAMTRPSHLPGLVVLYGPSGLGKTTAATAAVTQLGAYYVQVRSSWTRKAFYESILNVMGIVPAKTAFRMEEQITAQLAASDRPLIVDEADHLVARNSIEVVRDLYEGSNAAILLIGEENLPANLERWERIHNRVLEWVPAQFADMDDARTLRDLYCRTVRIEDDLLARIHELSRGVTRRLVVNFERVQQVALTEGVKVMDLDAWGVRKLDTGESPKRRQF